MGSGFRHRARRAAVVAAMLAAAPAIAATGDVSALLLKKTEAFSDAGPLGDGKAMAAMADDRLIFFNENGEQSTKPDLASITPGPANGITTRMKVSDWNIQVHGNVAVTSFIDNQERTDAHGQVAHARFRSVETWLKEGGDWRMIGSETVALADDPAVIAMTPAELDEYAGTYRAASGQLFTVARQGSELAAATGDQPFAIQKAEQRDIFFTPGLARFVKIFQRDAVGKIVRVIYHRPGRDVVFDRLGGA
jgi:ketosteroid isomerase-like protein